jgi:hypothetical protein
VIMGHVGSHEPRWSSAKLPVGVRGAVTVALTALARPAGW